MADFPRTPFDVPIQVAGLDMIASVRITGYVREWAPDDDDPGAPDDLSFQVFDLRLDGGPGPRAQMPTAMDYLLERSPDIRAACLEAIACHNQPPEN
jgi:hypothetical protein